MAHRLLAFVMPKGANAGLPTRWPLFVNVADFDNSIAAGTSNGGIVLRAPRNLGGGNVAVIQEPAGAWLTLFEQAAFEWLARSMHSRSFAASGTEPGDAVR